MSHKTRKQRLLEFAKEKGTSIGDLDMQLQFLWKELGEYKSVMSKLLKAASIQEASDLILTQYEIPANQSDSVKAKRAAYGQKYYDKFAASPGKEADGEKEDKPMSYDPRKVIQVALGEVGYLEKKTNSSLDDKTANAGDKNYTKYARDLDALGFYNGKKQAVAWCDIFVDWCMVQAYGLEAAAKLTYQVPGKANCGAGCRFSRDYYKKNKRLFDTPQPGDQIFFYPKDGIGGSAIQHTGLVYEVDDEYVYTVEGNTNGSNGVISNGGGVCQKVYKLTNARIAGYGRPDWGMAEIPAEPEQTEMELPVASAKQMVVITSNNVNARIGDSQSFDSVGHVQKGDSFEWVATSPATGWHAIRMAKRICWVSPNYSKLVVTAA